MAAVLNLAKSEVDDDVRRWLQEIGHARKREKEYRKQGQRILDIYNNCKKSQDNYAYTNTQTPFNILYANTEILGPALYSQPPRPLIKRRFDDPDAVGKAAAEAGRRMLVFLLDTNSEDYSDFHSNMEDNILDACLPGRASMEMCYHAEIAGGEEYVEEDQKKTKPEEITFECVYASSVIWNRIYFGYARKWCETPWIAFELYYDKDEATKEFGTQIAGEMTYRPEVESSKDDTENKSSREESQKSERDVACVYKIWDKKSRCVLFVSAHYPKGYLKKLEDPYQLTGFFPIPEPLRLVPKANDQLPTALYIQYENQAKELNKITTRLNRLIEACKVRGVYNAAIEEIESLLKTEENGLVAASSGSTLQLDGGLDKNIWLMPIEKIVTVIQQLWTAREQCKSVIYEIIGIADIMRGATQASETLGAQQLKSQWGSLRLRRMQTRVANYNRDCLRIMLEMAVNRFQMRTWQEITQLKYLTPDQVAQAQQQLMLAQQQLMALQTQMPPAVLGQPPQMPPQAQQLQQQVAQLQQTLQIPQWEQVLQLLKDRFEREYHLTVETNSTVLPDATEDKQDISDLMNAIAQFLNGVAPLIQEGVMPFDVAKAMLLGVVRKYSFGVEVEQYIQSMQAPPAKSGDQGKTEALQNQLRAEEAQNSLNKRAANLDVRELKVKTSEDRLEQTEKHALENHAARKQELQDIGRRTVEDARRAAEDIAAKHKRDVQQTVDKFGQRVDQAQAKANAVKDDQRAAASEKFMKELLQGHQALTKLTADSHERLAKALDGLTKVASAKRVPVRDSRGLVVSFQPQVGA